MTKWIPCGRHFVEGDIIRWLEAVWERRTYGEKKARKIGSRVVTAQVTCCGPEWVDLKVIECTLEMYDGWMAGNLKPGEALRRRRGPLGMAIAGTVRREWSDESARSLVAREHFKPEAAVVAAQPAGEPSATGSRPGRAGTGRRGYSRRGRHKKGPRLQPGSR